MPDAPLISVSGAPLVIFNTTVAPLLSIGDVPDTLAMVSFCGCGGVHRFHDKRAGLPDAARDRAAQQDQQRDGGLDGPRC